MSCQPFEVISDCEEDIDEEFEELEENGGIRKNLLEEFRDIAKTNSNDVDNGREFMKVFLRIRPFTEEEIDSSQNKECMEIDGETAINLNAPRDSFTFKNEKRGREVTHRFTFSRVFGPETTQKQFFDDTSLDMVKDFMDGQNCLVFTYGVTNSGKTYTIQGTPKDGGMLPRTLDVLFNSIQNKHYHRMNLKPRYFCDVVKIDEKQEHMEGALRNGLLMSLNKEHFDLNSFLQLEDSHDFSKGSVDDSSLQASIKSQDGEQSVSENNITDCEDEDVSRVTDDTTLSVDAQGPIKFSIWVSFAEIYNELIYDLLEPCPEGKGKKRSTLKLGDDKNGNPYVKGLREVCVSSADEAYKILRVGKKNQRISSTKLNQSSSRSHCIFTIKVLRVVDVENPHAARVSRLSFVDLAGSERYTKTQNTGDRLKEAGNINTSLMTLSKCLDCLRYNQIHPNHPQIIPFRESKLTRLFQGFFCGKGKASMIVNINQCSATFDETYHALKFSAIAKQVTTKVSKPTDMVPPVEKSFRASFAFPVNSKASRMSIPWENGALNTPVGGKCEPIDEDEDENDDHESDAATYQKQLEDLVRVLQEHLIEEKKSKITLELKIREEVCAEMAEQLVSIESAYSERLQEEVNAVEENCDRRIELLAKSIKKTRKRARIEKQEDEEEEWVSSVQLHAERVKVQELTAQVNELESNVKSMRCAAEEEEKRFKAQEELIMELQSALETSSKELELAKSKLDKRDKMLREKDEIVQQLKKKLEDENEEALLQSKSQEKVHQVVQNLEQELNTKEAVIEEKIQETEQLKISLEELGRLAHEKSEELEKSVEKISMLERSVLEKDAIVADKMVLLENHDRLVSTFEKNIKETEEKLNKMTESFEKSEERVKDLEQSLKERENLLAERDDRLEEKKTLVKKLQNNIKEHEEALENNESFLGQLNDEVRQLTAKLNDVKTKEPEKEKEEEEKEENLPEGGLETALASKLANLKEQLVARDELMKELVQSLEDTRAQVELDKGDLVMLNNVQKDKIIQLENELDVLKKSAAGDGDSEKIIQTLKEKLKIAEQESLSAKEKDELSGFEKEEMICALATANACEEELKKQVQDAKQDLEVLKKSNAEANETIETLRRKLEDKNFEITSLQSEDDGSEELRVALEASNKKILELEGQLQEQKSTPETTLIEQEQLKETKAALDNANLKIGDLGECLSSKEHKITELMEELENVKKRVQDSSNGNVKIAKQGVDGTDAVLKEVKQESSSDVKEKTVKEIQELQRQLEVTTRALDKKNSQLISRNNSLKRLELSLTEKDNKIAELVKEKGQSVQTPAKDLRTKEEIKTLRRRVLQADKGSEDLKQKAQEYQNKFEEIFKQATEKGDELGQTREKLQSSEKRLNEMEMKLHYAEEEVSKAAQKLEANEKKLEVYRLQQTDAKEKAQETAKLLEQMKEEIEKAKEGQQDKIEELEDVRAKAEMYEKKVEEVKLQQSENVKVNEEKMASLLEKAKTSEDALAINLEKLKTLEESQEKEISNLREVIESKDKQIKKKEDDIKEIRQKLSDSDKEKTEELDKVWKTLVELQAVIKERGETIDDLENKLSKAEGRHSREKTTLENTVAKMKEVMETKGGDRKKQLSLIAELESKVEELQEKNKALTNDLEMREKDMDEIKRILEQQDAVMEEQQEALNERQKEIESLMIENKNLLDNVNVKEIKTESTTAEMRRLEGTLAVYQEKNEKLERELEGIRKNDHEFEISKMEISRDYEKEKTDILVKLGQKESIIAKLKTQHKSAQSEATKERKVLQQKLKDKEAEINKLTVRLQVVEGKKQEYEGLCQLKDADVRAANEEKEETLKAMREVFAVATAKKEEYQSKLESVRQECTEELQAKHEKEIERLKEEFRTGKLVRRMSDLKVEINKLEVKSISVHEKDSTRESPTTKRKDKTNESVKEPKKSSQDQNVPEEDKKDEVSEKSNEKANTLVMKIPVANISTKDLKDEPTPEGRLEIDVTPVRRKRTTRVSSRSTARKRRSSELPLSEVKSQLSARKTRKQVEQNDDEFTPRSLKQKEHAKRSTRKAKANLSSPSSSTKSQRPSVKLLTPMNEVKEANPESLKKQSSIKKKRFLGKLFSHTDGEENTPPPKKGRKLLKKDISAPMDNFSPIVASIDSVPKNKEKNKAHSIITRQLRSRAIKF